MLHPNLPVMKWLHLLRSSPIQLLNPLGQVPQGGVYSAKPLLQVSGPPPRETLIPSANLETVFYAPELWKRTPFLRAPDFRVPPGYLVVFQN